MIKNKAKRKSNERLNNKKGNHILYKNRKLWLLSQLNKINPNYLNYNTIKFLNEKRILILFYFLIQKKTQKKSIRSFDIWFLSFQKFLNANLFTFKNFFHFDNFYFPINFTSKIIESTLFFVLDSIYKTKLQKNNLNLNFFSSSFVIINFLKIHLNFTKYFIQINLNSILSEINFNLLFKFLSKKIQCIKTILLLFKFLINYLNSNKESNKLFLLLQFIYLNEINLFLFKIFKFLIFFISTNTLYNFFNPKFLNFNNNLSHFFWFFSDNFFFIFLPCSFSICLLIQKIIYNYFFFKLKIKLSNSDFLLTFFLENKIFFFDILIKKFIISYFFLKVLKLNLKIKLKLGKKIKLASVYQNLGFRGFNRANKKIYRPTAIFGIQNWEHCDILNFFNFKTAFLKKKLIFLNKNKLKFFFHFIKTSCALTLALKYKLRTKAKVLKKFGHKLQCPKTFRELFFLY